jgi:hypothetical protein
MVFELRGLLAPVVLSSVTWVGSTVQAFSSWSEPSGLFVWGTCLLALSVLIRSAQARSEEGASRLLVSSTHPSSSHGQFAADASRVAVAATARETRVLSRGLA